MASEGENEPPSNCEGEGSFYRIRTPHLLHICPFLYPIITFKSPEYLYEI